MALTKILRDRRAAGSGDARQREVRRGISGSRRRDVYPGPHGRDSRLLGPAHGPRNGIDGAPWIQSSPRRARQGDERHAASHPGEYAIVGAVVLDNPFAKSNHGAGFQEQLDEPAPAERDDLPGDGFQSVGEPVWPSRGRSA